MMSSEKADLLESLNQHRSLLKRTVRDLDDVQAAKRTTVSELSLGGLIKHVTAMETVWVDFILNGPAQRGSFEDMSEEDIARWANQFRMADGETLAGLLAAYDEAARRTDEVVLALPDLDASHPLPPAPWFKPGATRSARRALIHIVAETAQHAGHADIIRESLDGAKSMG